VYYTENCVLTDYPKEGYDVASINTDFHTDIDTLKNHRDLYIFFVYFSWAYAFWCVFFGGTPEHD